MRLSNWIACFLLLSLGGSLLTGCSPITRTHSAHYLHQHTVTVQVDKPEDWEEADDVRRFTEARITNRFSRESIDAPVKLGSVRDEGTTLSIEVILDTEDTLDGYEHIELTDIYGERFDATAR